MSRLPDAPPFMPNEPLHGFVSRTARCYGTDLPTFCDETGLSRRGIIAGRPEQLEKLSELTDIAPAVLAGQAFVPDGGLFRFHGQQLHRLGLRRMTLIVCPFCMDADHADTRLAPDEAAYVRADWLVKGVRTCEAHEVALVAVDDVEKLDNDSYHDLAKRVAPSLAAVDALKREAEPRRPTDLERYVVGKLRGDGVTGGFADTMPLYAAIRACEMLGVATLFGPKTAMRVLTADEWRAAGSVGFDVMALGREAVSSCLAGLMANHGTANRNAGVNKVYGRLYQWLKTKDSGSGYASLRDVLREVIFDTIPLAAGTEVLGVVLPRRRLHSLRSAVIETGTSLKGLRRELRASGALPTDPGRIVAIHVDQTAIAVEDLADSLSRKETVEYLDTSVATLKLLVKAGLLTPTVGRASGLHQRFSRKHLDALLSDVMGGITDVRPAGGEMQDIATVARATNQSFVAIVELVKQRALRHVVREEGLVGLRAVLVDVDEVRTFQRSPSGLRISELAQRLHVHRQTANALLTGQHIEMRLLKLPMSRLKVMVADEASVASFDSEFVSLSALSLTHGMHHGGVKYALDRAGLQPAISGVFSFIYRRADVERLGSLRPTFPSKGNPTRDVQRGKG